jgi:hypothetical protein
MAVNRKTAMPLGLTVPLSILLRSNEVIELGGGAGNCCTAVEVRYWHLMIFAAAHKFR